MLLCLFKAVHCEEPSIPTRPEGGFIHFQSFSDSNWNENWKFSELTNYSGQWVAEETAAPQSVSGEKMLFMKTAMAYYGASTKFAQPLVLKGKTLVVQYEVRFQEALECGGAYMKLFSTENFAPTTLSNESRYSIMFGPDKCGATNKVHFIFRHKNPITGVIEEKHMKDAPAIKTDKINHLYTLIVRPDNSFEVLIDAESVRQGSLLTDFAPSVNPPKEIDDPTDIKPSDWVDEEMIPDPEAKKPEDWDETQPEFIPDPTKLNPPEGWLKDEPKFIPDPESKKPEDWDDDIHGEWEPPTVANPKCDAAPGCGEYEAPLIKNDLFKGKWKAPMIKNPAFKGVWRPRQIPNPHFFEDKEPHNFMAIAGAGFELWMVNKEIGFTNIFIGNDEAALHKWNKDHFLAKHAAQEAERKKLEPEEKTEKGAGFVGALTNFGTTLKDAFMNLYNENAVMTLSLAGVAALIPIIIIFVACCKKSPAPIKEEESKPEQKPKVEEVKVEEKPKVEEVKVEEKPKEEIKPKIEEVVEEPKGESVTRRTKKGGKKEDGF